MPTPHSEKTIFTGWLRRVTGPLVTGIARFIVNLGITPNLLTLTGFLIVILAAYFAAAGKTTVAGIIYLTGAAFDGLDGAVARVGKKSSRFGAFLDSTLDRCGEGLFLGAVGYQMARSGHLTGLALALIALVGATMVSYTRARSESLEIENKVGLATRVERTIVIVLSFLSGQVLIGLWLLAIFTPLTVIQRILAVYRSTRGE